MNVLNYIENIPEGYSEGFYEGVKYGITKSVFNNSKSFKIYAKELQGTNFISLNFYITAKKEFLKPCEMTEQKVIAFLKHIKFK
ncbi:peptide methionine sulfoxide reductase [Cognatitamlana onchidii]|uniref:peptide methionine sulfoxide reductase n=1 Tax=Cognatitamlana onchidii TaxID=2562860 RepID=UPI0010A69CA7|nr:peptide methionine sulfoxide reductase [Algibacter onchidii]